MSDAEMKYVIATEKLKTNYFLIRAIYEHFAIEHFDMSDAMDRFYRFLFYKDDINCDISENLINKENFDIEQAKNYYDELVETGYGESRLLIKRLVSCGYSSAIFRTDNPTAIGVSKFIIDNIDSDNFSKILELDLDYVQNPDNAHIVLATLNLINKINKSSFLSELIADYNNGIRQFVETETNNDETDANHQSKKNDNFLAPKDIVKINLLFLREIYKLISDNKYKSINLFYKFLYDENKKLPDKCRTSSTNPYSRFYDEYLRTGNGNIKYMLNQLENCGFDMCLFDDSKPRKLVCDDSLYTLAYSHMTEENKEYSLANLQKNILENIGDIYDSHKQLFVKSVRILKNKIDELDSEYWGDLVDIVTDIEYKESRLSVRRVKDTITDIGKQYKKIKE